MGLSTLICIYFYIIDIAVICVDRLIAIDALSKDHTINTVTFSIPIKAFV